MKAKLNDVCELIVDCPHSTEPDEGQGYPIIRTPNIGVGYLDLSGVQRVSKEAYDRRNARAVPRANDLILAREAPAGNVGIIREGMKVCLGQRTVLIRPDAKEVNPLFLNYYLNAPVQRHALLSNSNGATVSHVNMPIIRNLPVELPDLETQKRLANVLSAYDELIENNRKQIKLLEEAAQRLYKEWFVDLKFPGHETTPIHNGLPEGWSKVALAEIASINVRSLCKSSMPGTISYIDLSCVSEGNVCSRAFFRREDAPGRARRLAKDGSIAWGMVRPAQRSFALIRHPPQDTVLSTGFAIIDAETVPFSFLYEELSGSAFTAYLTGLTNGSTYPAVKPEHFSRYRLIVPNHSLLKRFDDFVLPALDSVFALRRQIAAAREARDRLLPKLMSGEIEV